MMATRQEKNAARPVHDGSTGRSSHRRKRTATGVNVPASESAWDDIQRIIVFLHRRQLRSMRTQCSSPLRKERDALPELETLMIEDPYFLPGGRPLKRPKFTMEGAP